MDIVKSEEKVNARVAVLLAAFNGLPWIEEQIRSILSQEGVQLTLFVSVDKSTDGTESCIDCLANDDPRLIVLPYGRSFEGPAEHFFNLMCETQVSDYDYVAFADQDDIWLPHKLIRAVNKMLTEKAEAYSSSVIASWTDGTQCLVKKSQPQVKWDFLFESAGPGCTYVLSSKLAKDIREYILSRPALIQDMKVHDWFFYAYARLFGYRWTIDDEPLVIYRQHAMNAEGANIGWKAWLRRFNKIRSGWWLRQVLTIADTFGLRSHAPVSIWLSGTWRGYVHLGYNFWQCRRRFRDKIIFLGICMLFALCNIKIFSSKNSAHKGSLQ